MNKTERKKLPSTLKTKWMLKMCLFFVIPLKLSIIKVFFNSSAINITSEIEVFNTAYYRINAANSQSRKERTKFAKNIPLKVRLHLRQMTLLNTSCINLYHLKLKFS